ncbi:hypothetical protein BB561_000080 [Smittium simulii]|uniref:Iron-sulfur assembly protein 1 n=1 Tax=Smittium simulii TaxID=133385 RepID=A0A2T9XXZ7_9FUNG|nr:hypothetical protein BB561_007008 [Smittium simulii]PVU98164.1 hypothetical protein BB561_000080 [Smittium simulii]
MSAARIGVRLAPRLKASKSVLTITPIAANRIRELTKKTPEGSIQKFLKIGIQGKGCSGSAYTMNWVDKPEKFDEVVKQDDITVLVDSKALLTLIGTEMDYFDGKLASKFIFNNPNVKAACGCGESFMV